VYHDFAHPLDVCVLLRAHGEQLWLATEVMPVLDELEAPYSIPANQVGAAFAYLEVLSIDAAQRAGETDAAFAAMVANPDAADRSFRADAYRYHAAVRELRGAVARRVARVTRAAAPAAA
jgi:hypothetical protein